MPPCCCSERSEQRQVRRQRLGLLRSGCRGPGSSGSEFCSAGPAVSVLLPSVVSAWAPRLANSGVPVTNVLMSLAAPAQRLDAREERRREVAEAVHRRHELAQELRQQRGSSPRARRSRSAVAVAVVAEELMKPRMRRRSRAIGASTLSPLTASVASVLFCSARSFRTLSNCAQRGVGLAQRRLQRGAVAGERRAELVEEDRELLPVGQAHDVLHQVEVDRAGGVRRREQVLPLARARTGPWRGSGDFGALVGLGCVGSHSMKRSPMSDCGRIVQKRVLAEVVVVRVVDLQDDRGLLVVGQVDRRDAADDDAADADVHARDHERGVVEDRADAGSRPLSLLEPVAKTTSATLATSTAAMASRRFMGRGARSRDRSRGCRSRHATARCRPRAPGTRRPGSARRPSGWRRRRAPAGRAART